MEKTTKDPVIARVLDALSLFRKGIGGIMSELNQEFMTLDRINNASAIILTGITKGGERNLKNKGERDAFLHILNETGKTLAVVLKGCKDYGIKYGTTSIPDVIIYKIIDETNRQILNQ